MGTKRNPGAFDCYAAAESNEPFFVLLGRDKHAPALVRQWADWREQDGEDPAKIAEARTCADAMEAWLALLGKGPAFKAPISAAPAPEAARVVEAARSLLAAAVIGDTATGQACLFCAGPRHRYECPVPELYAALAALDRAEPDG